MLSEMQEKRRSLSRIFCNSGERNEDWIEFIKILKDKKVEHEEAEIIEREGKAMCSCDDGTMSDLSSEDLKFLARGTLPIGAIDSMDGANNGDAKTTMSHLWKTLVSRVKKRSESQIATAEDKHAMEHLESLKSLRIKSNKLRSAASKESAEKIKKRKHEDFCYWERQVKNEHRSEKKLKEK